MHNAVIDSDSSVCDGEEDEEGKYIFNKLKC